MPLYLPFPPLAPRLQADFGLSKHKYNTFCSNVHDLRGTLPYMAPEMIMDHTHVTGGWLAGWLAGVRAPRVGRRTGGWGLPPAAGCLKW